MALNLSVSRICSVVLILQNLLLVSASEHATITFRFEKGNDQLDEVYYLGSAFVRNGGDSIVSNIEVEETFQYTSSVNFTNLMHAFSTADDLGKLKCSKLTSLFLNFAQGISYLKNWKLFNPKNIYPEGKLTEIGLFGKHKLDLMHLNFIEMKISNTRMYQLYHNKDSCVLFFLTVNKAGDCNITSMVMDAYFSEKFSAKGWSLKKTSNAELEKKLNEGVLENIVWQFIISKVKNAHNLVQSPASYSIEDIPENNNGLLILMKKGVNACVDMIGLDEIFDTEDKKLKNKAPVLLKYSQPSPEQDKSANTSSKVETNKDDVSTDSNKNHAVQPNTDLAADQKKVSYNESSSKTNNLHSMNKGSSSVPPKNYDQYLAYFIYMLITFAVCSMLSNLYLKHYYN